MKLISGYFRHSRGLGALHPKTVSEVFVCEVAAPAGPDECLVGDGAGRIPAFALGNTRGHLRYRLGDGCRRFWLAEGDGRDSFVVDGRRVCICSEESESPARCLVLSGGELLEAEEGVSDAEDLQLDFMTGREHLDIVESFLRQTEPQPHARFLHFCISNISTVYGQTLSTCSGGRVVYHTVVSSHLLNLNELFLSLDLLPGLVDVPYFPHTNFIVSSCWEEIYESKKYMFECSYPPGFVLEILSAILLEERVVFHSACDAVLRVLQLLSLLRPFRWPHILCLPLPVEMEEILDSPLPFIVSITRDLRREGVVFVDLDALEVHSSRRCMLPVDRGMEEDVSDCAGALARRIVMKREDAIRKHRGTMLREIINDPARMLEAGHPFLESFFKTRMFLMFVTEERSHRCRYLVELGKPPTVIMLPHVLLMDDLETRAVRLWIGLFDGNLGPVVEHLRHRGILDEVADVVFRRLSSARDYEGISRVLQSIQSPTHDMYMSINIASTMPRIRFGDLCGYTVYHLRGCDCGALLFDRSRMECLRPCDVSMQRRERIRGILRGMDQRTFNLDIRECVCCSSVSMILVDGPGYAFLCFLLAPENVSIVLGEGERLLETHPQAYWSIVTYFAHFNLPLSWDVVECEMDIVVEETSSFDFQIDGRPRFVFSP